MANIQIVKIGLVGFEQTIPSENLQNSGTNTTEVSQTGRSADGTLLVDYTTKKISFNYNYLKITEATKDLLEVIYQLQIDNQTTLSLIFTNENGVPQTKSVRLLPISFGVLLQTVPYYYENVSLVMEEV